MLSHSLTSIIKIKRKWYDFLFKNQFISGSCSTTPSGQPTRLGNFNSRLLFNTSTLYLLYDNGAPCQKSNSDSAATTASWSTKIEFVCAYNGTTNTNTGATALIPKIIENSNCQVLIHYPTELACKEPITCKAKWYDNHPKDGSTGEQWIDLTPLISTTANYEATIDSSSITEKEVGNSTKVRLCVCVCVHMCLYNCYHVNVECWFCCLHVTTCV